MSIVIAHPTGNEFFKAAVKGFHDAGKLQSIYTSVASFPGTMLYKLGGIKVFNDIRRRALDKRLQALTHIHPIKEAGRLLSIKLKQQKLIQHERGIFSVDAVYKSLDKYVAENLEAEQLKGATMVYSYEDGAAYSFKKAKLLGIKRVYDLPIGYWRTMRDMLSAEKELNPEWALTLDGNKNSEEKLNRKDEEIALANTIIVASSFTFKSLDNYPGELPEIKLIPYGFPPVNEKTYRRIQSHDKIKLLFVGGLSQRKGLSYLFKAMEGFESSVSLTVIGRSIMKHSKILTDNLSKHTWIQSLPHHEVLQQMKKHDVLIFPSLFEGFGQVITEAMAQGTPVITTERTAGPDIINHDENGWLANAGSVEALKVLIEKLILHPELIEVTGREALKTAAHRPWERYGKEIANVDSKSGDNKKRK